MNKIETGGPAYPILAEQATDGWAHCGMNLRDYFAAKAIGDCLTVCATNTKAAEEAYKIADAMLEARK